MGSARSPRVSVPCAGMPFEVVPRVGAPSYANDKKLLIRRKKEVEIMAKNTKSGFKVLAKMAKNRLKNGFWEDYKTTVQNGVTAAETEGLARSNVINYYKARVSEKILRVSTEEDAAFYQRVKHILDTYGDVSDILGRLCDEEYMSTLVFEQKQRYLFNLAARYRECRTRYEQEKKFSVLTADNLSEKSPASASENKVV